MSSARATVAPGPMRFGPRTTPTVVAHTTTDSARARCPASARSAAAYLDCRLVAVPLPRSSAPRSTRTKASKDAPAVDHAPPAGGHQVDRRRRPGRLPAGPSTVDIGSAATAPPSTEAVWLRPDSSVEPDTSSASRPPTAMALPDADAAEHLRRRQHAHRPVAARSPDRRPPRAEATTVTAPLGRGLTPTPRGSRRTGRRATKRWWSARARSAYAWANRVRSATNSSTRTPRSATTSSVWKSTSGVSPGVLVAHAVHLRGRPAQLLDHRPQLPGLGQLGPVQVRVVRRDLGHHVAGAAELGPAEPRVGVRLQGGLRDGGPVPVVLEEHSRLLVVARPGSARRRCPASSRARRRSPAPGCAPRPAGCTPAARRCRSRSRRSRPRP